MWVTGLFRFARENRHPSPITDQAIWISCCALLLLAAGTVLAQIPADAYKPVPGQPGKDVVWIPTPEGRSSEAFATELLDEAGVVVAPGTGYGPSGEGYIRLSITIPDSRLDEGCERVRKALVGR